MTILVTGAAGFIGYHLAAHAGVRHSIDNPHAYTESNVTGFLRVPEGCRRSKIARLIYASSGSVPRRRVVVAG